MVLRRNGVASLGVMVISTLVVVLAAQAQLAAAAGYDAYQAAVREEVQKAISSYPGVGAGLIRLVFHDCWVYGCDGSVLLESTPYNSSRGLEKDATNNIGLRGFDVIDTIKARLIGHDVSCADIVVFAAREAAFYLSGGRIAYDVYPGLKDGVVSSAVDADATLPGSTFSFQQLKDNFYSKGFTQEELVILSGAHSVGVCHFSSFKDRFNPTTATPIDPKYKAALLADDAVQMGLQGKLNPTLKNNIRDMDPAFRKMSGYKDTGVQLNTPARDYLDNSYYSANLQNMVLLKSDWVLRTDGNATNDLQEYRNNATKWNVDFGNAMAKLSKLTAQGAHFETRTNCRSTN